MRVKKRIPKYQPSDYIQSLKDSGKLDRMWRLPQLVADARKQGLRVCIDLGEDELDLEEVNSKTVARACHEVDEAVLRFIHPGGKLLGWMLVIPNNGGPDEWLVDYSVYDWLEQLVKDNCYEAWHGWGSTT